MWLLPSAVFAVLHYQPDLMGENAWTRRGRGVPFRTSRRGPHGKNRQHRRGVGVPLRQQLRWRSCILAMDLGRLSGLALYTVPMADLSAVDLRPLLSWT